MADDEKHLIDTDESDRRPGEKPPLEKVDETGRQTAKRGLPCPDFGVKSYLNQFYDSKGSFQEKDPNIYEEDEDDDLAYLLRPRKKKACTSIWWKIFVWIGANLLIFGIIGILISFLIPPHGEVISVKDDIEKVDRGAVYFNYSLDVCKLISLIVFCIGGVTLTVALIFPSFFNHYCDDSRRSHYCDDEFKVRLTADEPSDVKRIPVTAKISSVQPREKGENTVKFAE